MGVPGKTGWERKGGYHALEGIGLGGSGRAWGRKRRRVVSRAVTRVNLRRGGGLKWVRVVMGVGLGVGLILYNAACPKSAQPTKACCRQWATQRPGQRNFPGQSDASLNP